jgi:UDP-N-acetylmuramyl pentapeptide phosphotransferase/UDP-N-acetylglucosamine-1-phosphate transferase
VVSSDTAVALALLSLGGLVFGTAAWLTRRLAAAQTPLARLDQPNERSLHAAPTPRGGGLAIVGGLALGVLLGLAADALLGWRALSPLAAARPEPALWLLGAALLMAAISFWDDQVGLAPAPRFAVHALAAASVVLGAGFVVRAVPIPGLGALPLTWLAAPLSLLGVIWMANLYNFMDGMDGFAGGMAVLGFGFLAALGATGGHRLIGLLALLTACAAGGFLLFNVPPARIFMGDVGSIFLGFLAGSLALAGVHDGLFDLWVPLLVFSPFILDATATLLRRLARGERIWQAHREHHYQRLVLAGWTHRKTVFAEYGLMVACGLSALVYQYADAPARLAVLLTWAMIYGALAYAVSLVERRANPPQVKRLGTS